MGIEYRVRPISGRMPEIAEREFDPERESFCIRNTGVRIDKWPWDRSGYRPEACAWMTRGSAGLCVLLAARETEIQVRAKAFNGEVWKDSCLECFLRPIASDPRYLNIEVNAAGAALIGLGEGRNGRRLLERMPEGMGLTASVHRGAWWAVSYTIPWTLIGTLFGAVPEADAEMYGNFYKCEESLHPHFGVWSPVTAPEPDFHRPECFGTLVLAE